MNSFTRFLDMGGYAAAVWPAYGITVLVLGGFTASAVIRYRAAQRLLARLQARPREQA
jgi:heme exporter protein D